MRVNDLNQTTRTEVLGESQLEPWRGPHQGRELELMLAGTKPVAMPDSQYMPGFEPYIKQGRFVAKRFRIGRGFSRWLVAQPDKAPLMDEVIEIYRQINARGEMTLRDHRRIGEILGYDPDHIDKFVDYMRGQGVRESLTEGRVIPVELYAMELPLKVYVDPTQEQLAYLVANLKTKGEKLVRFLADDKHVYAWDGGAAIHSQIADKLGINRNYSGSEGYYWPNAPTGYDFIFNADLAGTESVNRFRRTASAEKLARPRKPLGESVEELAGVRFWINPSPNEAIGAFNRSAAKMLRGVVDHNGVFVVWDSHQMTHFDAVHELRLNGLIERDINPWLIVINKKLVVVYVYDGHRYEQIPPEAVPSEIFQMFISRVRRTGLSLGAPGSNHPDQISEATGYWAIPNRLDTRYWIRPDGSILDVKDSHETTASDHFGEPESDDDTPNQKAAFAAGWIRVAADSAFFAVSSLSRSTPEQRRALIGLIRDSDSRQYAIDDQDGFVDRNTYLRWLGSFGKSRLQRMFGSTLGEAFDPWAAKTGLRKFQDDQDAVGYWYEPATGKHAVVPWDSVRPDIHHWQVLFRNPERFGIDPALVKEENDTSGFGTDAAMWFGISRGWVRASVHYGGTGAVMDARTPADAQKTAQWLVQNHPGITHMSVEIHPYKLWDGKSAPPEWVTQKYYHLEGRALERFLSQGVLGRPKTIRESEQTDIGQRVAAFRQGYVYHGCTRAQADNILKHGFRLLRFRELVAEVAHKLGLPAPGPEAYTRGQPLYTEERFYERGHNDARVSSAFSPEIASRWAGTGGETVKNIEGILLGKRAHWGDPGSKFTGEPVILRVKLNQKGRSNPDYQRILGNIENYENLIRQGKADEKEMHDHFVHAFSDCRFLPDEVESVEEVPGAFVAPPEWMRPKPVNEAREVLRARPYPKAVETQIRVLVDPSPAELVGFAKKFRYVRGIRCTEPMGNDHYVFWDGYDAIHDGLRQAVDTEYGWTAQTNLEIEHAGGPDRVTGGGSNAMGPFYVFGPEEFREGPYGVALARTRIKKPLSEGKVMQLDIGTPGPISVIQDPNSEELRALVDRMRASLKARQMPMDMIRLIHDHGRVLAWSGYDAPHHEVVQALGLDYNHIEDGAYYPMTGSVDMSNRFKKTPEGAAFMRAVAKIGQYGAPFRPDLG